MNIKSQQLNTLWYENNNGEKWIPPNDGHPFNPPNGFIYQNSMFPNYLHHNILRLISDKEVNECVHPKKYINNTHGWVDGIEGRECLSCGGTQTKEIFFIKPKWLPSFLWPNIRKPWPKKWDGHGSRKLAHFESGWSEDLVLSMANSGEFKLSEAILIAANSCERCINALAYKYKVGWGYCEGSEDWHLANTSCIFCTIDKQKETNK